MYIKHSYTQIHTLQISSKYCFARQSSSYFNCLKLKQIWDKKSTRIELKHDFEFVSSRYVTLQLRQIWKKRILNTWNVTDIFGAWDLDNGGNYLTSKVCQLKMRDRFKLMSIVNTDPIEGNNLKRFCIPSKPFKKCGLFQKPIFMCSTIS